MSATTVKPSASPCLTASLHAAKATWTALAATSTDSADPENGLASIIDSGLKGKTLQPGLSHKTATDPVEHDPVVVSHPLSRGHDANLHSTINAGSSRTRTAHSSASHSEATTISRSENQAKTTTSGKVRGTQAVHEPTPAMSAQAAAIAGSHSRPGAIARVSDASDTTLVDEGTYMYSLSEPMASGISEDRVSSLEHNGRTFANHKGPSTIFAQTSSIANPGKTSETFARPAISLDSKSHFIVDGKTLAPSLPITLQGKDGPVTFRMLTLSSSTYIAIDSSQPVPLAGDPETRTSSHVMVALAFTQASDGNFVLNGTTLASGQPITLGTGDMRTTLRMTTVSSTPAVVLDGTTTELLGYQSSPSLPLSSITSPFPSITEPSSVRTLETAADGAEKSSTTSHSGSCQLRFCHMLLILAFALVISWTTRSA